MTDVLVFKTNVFNKNSVESLKPFLDELLVNLKWNFDLEDCDKILRVESERSISRKIVRLLKEKGFSCIELKS
ncbi:hypothetical protein HHX25_09610 [Flavivirga sp. Y03]|uniref:Uncharacterized protein n=2 Tax=Flavivirga algicola TaxID=2729136 RepID=A0ABX1RZJ2_9FLAO|nr:hypothetical protein [Flavivirga algicola]